MVLHVSWDRSEVGSAPSFYLGPDLLHWCSPVLGQNMERPRQIRRWAKHIKCLKEWKGFIKGLYSIYSEQGSVETYNELWNLVKRRNSLHCIKAGRMIFFFRFGKTRSWKDYCFWRFVKTRSYNERNREVDTWFLLWFPESRILHLTEM